MNPIFPNNEQYAHRIGPLQVFNPTPELYNRYTFTNDRLFDDEETVVRSYFQYKDTLLIPRYGIHNVKKALLNEGKDIKIQCNAEPKNKLQKRAVDFIINHNDCIINFKPGKGKTVIAIMAICKIKKKTLVIVDQDNILEQWKNRIKQFTNLSDSHIGIIKGDKTDINKPVVLAMVQTLKNRVLNNIDEIREQLKDFGVVVVDEIHTIIGTDKLNLALYSTSSKRLIGLTATLFRSDKRDHLFYEWFSNNVIEDDGYNIAPTIFTIKLPTKYNAKDIRYIMYTGHRDNVTGELKVKEFLNKSRWMKKLIKNEAAINTMVNVIKIMYEKYNRTILAVSDYVDLLQIIAKNLPSFYDMVLYTKSEGSMKKVKKVLEPTKDLTRKLTLTTYKMCGKAIDRPDWDCLIKLTPISSTSPLLEQVIGRICREYRGKENAVVIDFYDDKLPRMKAMFEGRLRFYKKRGFNVINLK